MPIFSDLELERIMNEAGLKEDDDKSLIKKVKDTAKERTSEIKDNVKKNIWINKKKQKETSVKEDGMTSFNFIKDKNGNIVDGYSDDEPVNEFFNTNINKTKISNSAIQLKDKTMDSATDLKIGLYVDAEKEKQEWQEKPVEKTTTTIADTITGGGVIRKGAKLLGKGGDNILKKLKKSREKDVKTEDTIIYRSPEFTKVMNEYFDITDTETRKVLLAVNESDQNKVLVSLTSKLYDNIINKVDDIDFGVIPATKGDITKLPNYLMMLECISNMKNILIEFKQDTSSVDTLKDAIDNVIDTKDIWTKAYAINVELPMITYNTIVLAIIEGISYLVSMCIEFVKSPSEDTMKVMIDKSALTKSKQHLTFKNLESFNTACDKGQVQKAMEHVISETINKKNFIGMYGVGVGAAVISIASLLFCIIPVIRELIFLFYYYRVRISEFFDVQADMLQINAYNVENNRLDLTKEEKKKISTKQMKVAERFRSIAQKIEVSGKTAEKEAVKEAKKEANKKYKADEVMEELPDSASSALF